MNVERERANRLNGLTGAVKNHENQPGQKSYVLYQRIISLRRLTPLVILVLALLPQLLLWALPAWIPPNYRIWLAMLFYGVPGSLVILVSPGLAGQAGSPP